MTGGTGSPAETGVRDTLAEVAEKVEERLGLIHSEKREEDIARVAADMAGRKGLLPADILRGLAALPPEEPFPEGFVSALTVGETYFFRERKVLEAFSGVALAEMAKGEKNGLRVWSAGCSTGEEAYTVAMLLSDSALNLDAGGISILGSDIDPSALEKARRGIYSSWSFRGMSGDEIALYFEKEGRGRYSVREPFRRAVGFSRLNLASGPWRLWEDGGAPDAIFCRNVLIYFSDAKKNKVIERFSDLLPEGGWLVVSACEAASWAFEGFVPVDFDGATLYKKSRRPSSFAVKKPDFADSLRPAREEQPAGGGVPNRIIPPTKNKPTEGQPEEPAALSRADRAKRLADEGRLNEALDELEKAMEQNGTEPVFFYLRSLIHQEMGNRREAAATLRSVLYLDPDFVMAHYALGAMALGEGRLAEAERNLRNAEEALARMPADCLPPEGDGQTAKDLLKTVRELRDGIRQHL